MSQKLSKAQWDASPRQLAVTDRITVRNLQVQLGAGVDVWGRTDKQHRALVTFTLSLDKPFDSAAESDALDNSTVHYGILSKNVSASLQKSPSHGHMGAAALDILKTAKATAGTTPLTSIEADIFYPKGSMFGDGAGCTLGQRESNGMMDVYTQLYLRNVRIPCLIGVNPNERLQKQPVVVNVWIDPVDSRRHNDYQKLETFVVDVISGTSFETLESLTTTVIQELREKFFTEESDKDSFIRLRIEKPHAVPAADAPAIEIYRPVRV